MEENNEQWQGTMQAAPSVQEPAGQGAAYQDAYTPQQHGDDNLCKCCGIHSIDRSENPDSVLCPQCRDKLIKYPIPKKLFAALAIIAVLFIAALLHFPKSLQAMKTYDSAYSLAEQGYPNSALLDLDMLLQEYPGSLKISFRAVQLAMKYGYNDYAAYTINEYLTGHDLSDYQYDTLTGYIDELNRYYETSDAIDAFAAENGNMDADALFEYLSSIADNPGYDKALIYYYMGYSAPDEETSAHYMQKCYELDNNYTDAGAQIANGCRRDGDLATARQILEEAYERNKEAVDILRGLAILELLEDNPGRGLELSQAAYALEPEGAYVIDTYLVALSVNGMQAEIEAVKEEWQGQGVEFDAELESFLRGGVTLREYYID